MQPSDAATWWSVWVAVGVGAGGIAVGGAGLRIAMGARAEARRANELAKAALVGDDVTWSLWWSLNGLAVLQNDVTDVATKVRGSATVDGETESFGPETEVDNLGGVMLTFRNVPVKLAAEEASKNGGKVEQGCVLLDDYHERNHRVSWRITWETPLGRTMPPDVQTFERQPILPGTRVPAL
jgi:hypothetical protein